MRGRPRLCLLALLIALPVSASASSVDTMDLAGAARAGAGTIVRFSYANDFFVGSDEYFTQGLGLVVFDAKSGRGIVVRHDGFTPTSLRHDEALVGDRPFAATLTAGGVKVTREPRWTLTSEVDAGVIGPAAGGEWMQTSIHRATGNRLPHGWSNQIRDDVVLDASTRAETSLADGPAGSVRLYADGALGTLYTNGAVGALGRLGGRHVFVTAGAEEKIVGYDATLEGGVFNRSSPNVISAIERVVPRAEVGLTIDLGGFAIDARRVYLGREFEDGDPHQWMEIGFTGAF